MKKPRKMSPFEFEEGDLEISFTYFYFLGHKISRSENESISKENLEKLVKGFEYEEPGRWSVNVAHALRNEFIDQILIDHFYLNPKDVCNTELSFYEDGEGGYALKNGNPAINKEFKFELGCRIRAEQGSNDNSTNFFPPRAIECFLFKNGHLAVTLRLINSNAISAYDAVALIRQPDLIKVEPKIKRVGFLVRQSEILIKDIEKKLKEILKYTEIKKIRSGAIDEYDDVLVIPDTPEALKDSSAMSFLDEDGKRSIPYVGTTFSFRNSTADDLESLDMAIKRFVISAARATPAFLNSFTNPDSYLNTENRNAYVPGDNIVYIAKRGWCVFDAGVQDEKVFYNNVIETTNLAILLTYSTQRTWYQYYRFLKDVGKPFFDKLNESVIEFVKSEKESKKEANKKLENNKCKYFFNSNHHKIKGFLDGNCYLDKCKSAIADATGFIAKARILAPSSRMSQLFVAHMMSHTARAAVRRCEYICHLVEIEDAASKSLANYSNSLKIAASHFQSGARIFSEKGLKIGIISLVLSAFFGFVSMIINIVNM